jgi:putative flippase GtrA
VSTGLLDRAQAELRDPVRRRVVFGEIWRFGTVGGAGFLLDLGIFNVLIHLDVGPMTSKGISTTLAALLTYVLNRHWSFAHRETRGYRRDLGVFLVLSAIGLGIAEACLGISHYLLGFESHLADNVSGVLIGTALGTIWRFYSFKRWVFTKPGTRSDEVLAASVF